MTDALGKKVLFYVQHLLGVGHVFRARRLCEGIAAAGLSVEVIFGGVPLPKMSFSGAKVHFLPPVKAGAIDYSFNVDGEGNKLSHEYMALRKDKLLKVFADLAPDLILFEAWPFGRRFLRHEITAMLDEAKSRPLPPLVVTSVRDILQENRKEGRIDEVVTTINNYVDAVLVHSDPGLIRLEDTFPLAPAISGKVHYTGFVCANPPTVDRLEGKYDVIVTIGGGAFGEGLIETALAARSLSVMKDAQWCLCTGPNLPKSVVDRLRRNLPQGVTIKSFLPNLQAHLEKARLSISQAGYNTTMDVLGAGQYGNCKAVLVPSDIAGQSEQLRRAQLLHKSGLAISLPESKMDKNALATAIDSAMALPIKHAKLDFKGAETSASLIQDMLNAREDGR